MQRTFPPKLYSGDTIRVIAPSMSMAIISQTDLAFAIKQLEQLGLRVTFGKHVNERDELDSSSVSSRIEDLHEAFADPAVKAVWCATGGFNANELLANIDWEIITSHPKILCGKSDITTLNNAIFARTGVVTYSGPGIHTLSDNILPDYTIASIKQCLMSDEPFTITPSDQWCDWQENSPPMPEKNEGFWIIQEGKAEGVILGANLVTFNLLKGTPFYPDLTDSILFLEDDYEEDAQHIDSNLQSLLLTNGFSGVKGIVIGRFQKQSNISEKLLRAIIDRKAALRGLPIIANVNFGHTFPQITFPVGGTLQMEVLTNSAKLQVTQH